MEPKKNAIISNPTIDKYHLGCNFNIRNIIPCTRQPVLFSFVLYARRGQEIYERPYNRHYGKRQKKLII